MESDKNINCLTKLNEIPVHSFTRTSGILENTLIKSDIMKHMREDYINYF
jgi:hypothetical protein